MYRFFLVIGIICKNILEFGVVEGVVLLVIGSIWIWCFFCIGKCSDYIENEECSIFLIVICI